MQLGLALLLSRTVRVSIDQSVKTHETSFTLIVFRPFSWCRDGVNEDAGIGVFDVFDVALNTRRISSIAQSMPVELVTSSRASAAPKSCFAA